MNGDTGSTPGTPDATGSEASQRSGEGADTALQALIKKRKSNVDEPPEASPGAGDEKEKAR